MIVDDCDEVVVSILEIIFLYYCIVSRKYENKTKTMNVREYLNRLITDV